MVRGFSLAVVLLCGASSFAQTVEILAADQILRDPAITEAQRLIGHVKLGHQDAVLTCDSAWRFDDGTVEVFSNVHMEQPPSTTLTANHLRIEPENDWAEAQGEVRLLHESAQLQAPSLSYQIGHRTARYSQGALILEDGWTVTSQTGRYLASQSTLELGGDVHARKEGESMVSDSLHWLRNENRYTFHGATHWRDEEIEFACQSGDVTMDDGPRGWLSDSVVVKDNENTIHGDSIEWGENVSEVWGNVILTKADGSGEVHGAHAIQNKLDSLDMVEGTPDQKAWLQQVDNSDTLWLAAELLTRQGPALTAVRGVTLVQQDMTATGDSMVWEDDVELIHIWGLPELWSNQDKLSGDTLTLMMSDNKPDKLEMRGHAVVLSPANDTLSHRIQGRDLDAFFEDSELRSVDVIGNGEVVTFEVPEEGQEGSVRMNTAVCAKVTLEVAEQKLKGIALKQGPRGRIEPIPQGQGLESFQVDEAPRSGPWETSEQGPPPE